jgi:hypothetical protein
LFDGRSKPQADPSEVERPVGRRTVDALKEAVNQSQEEAVAAELAVEGLGG